MRKLRRQPRPHCLPDIIIAHGRNISQIVSDCANVLPQVFWDRRDNPVNGRFPRWDRHQFFVLLAVIARKSRSGPRPDHAPSSPCGGAALKCEKETPSGDQPGRRSLFQRQGLRKPHPASRRLDKPCLPCSASPCPVRQMTNISGREGMLALHWPWRPWPWTLTPWGAGRSLWSCSGLWMARDACSSLRRKHGRSTWACQSENGLRCKNSSSRSRSSIA